MLVKQKLWVVSPTVVGGVQIAPDMNRRDVVLALSALSRDVTLGERNLTNKNKTWDEGVLGTAGQCLRTGKKA